VRLARSRPDERDDAVFITRHSAPIHKHDKQTRLPYRAYAAFRPRNRAAACKLNVNAAP